MTNIVCSAILILAMAGPVMADERYKFKVSVTTTFEALGKVDPRLQEAQSAGSEATRLRIKTDQVMLFERREGTSGWRATFSSCGKDIKDCEVRITSRTCAGYERDADPELAARGQRFDLGFSQNADGTLRVRCLRPACTVRFEKDSRTGELSLVFGDSGDLPTDSEVDARFP